MSVPFVDLANEMEGVSATYRVSDWHWTEKGTEIVASRVLEEL